MGSSARSEGCRRLFRDGRSYVKKCQISVSARTRSWGVEGEGTRRDSQDLVLAILTLCL